MIIREWRCCAKQADAAKYPDYFRKQIMQDLRAAPGFLGATFCQRPSGEFVEFLVFSRWVSMDAIRGFAGTNPDNAVIDTVAMALVATYDDKVRHYEVLEDLLTKKA
jgi:heme-degrading monooxygenase HmoA